MCCLGGQSQTITTGAITGSPFCPGATVNVSYTATGTFSSTNVFRAQLSNSSGSFASGVTVIGSRTATISGTIAATIPSTAAAGTAYRIRVISTSPAITGSNNGTNLTILAAVNCGTSWSTTGNGGITRNNFIGTLTDSPLIFRVGNARSGMITKAGNNVSLGFESLLLNTTGVSNTACGSRALLANSTGSYNTASGSGSLYSNTTGVDNTASGFNSLTFNTTGVSNTASGSNALYSNTIGGNNMAGGFQALFSNTTGSNNTASGSLSLFFQHYRKR